MAQGYEVRNAQGQRAWWDGKKLTPLDANGMQVKTSAMPGGVLNKLNEDVVDVGTGSALNARMDPYRSDLDSQRINLGPVRNLFMDAQNFMGASSEGSRRYATFRSDLEKMRNDSLRLNKGVQTEGDAIRAWNELFKNLNDEKLVSERLAQIQGYNDDAIRLKKGVVDSSRQQYGLGGYDWSKVDVPRNRYQKGPAPAQPQRKPLSDIFR